MSECSKEDVALMNIPMDDAMRVHERNSKMNMSEDPFYYLLGEY